MRANINIHHGDCMEAMAKMPDNAYDLAIVDPEYGININHNMGRRKGDKHSGHKKVEWDKKPPSQEYFYQVDRVSKNQIIWGANYFKMPPCKGFIVWKKPQISEAMSFAMCEYAWSSFDKTAKIIELYNGDDKIHPTQKPVALYKWLRQNYAKEGDKILDTHGGSMGIAIACWDLKFDLDLWELDEDYYKAGKERFESHTRQYQFDF